MQVGLRGSLAGLCLALVAAACSGTKSNGNHDLPDGAAGAAGDDSGAAGAGVSSTGGSTGSGGKTAGGGAGAATAGNGGATAGKSGNGGNGGSGGAVIKPGAGTLGSPCADDVGDCKAGLTCLTPTSTELNNHGAPPHGLCTLACTADEECAPHGAGALCVPFGDATTAFCVEGCSFGEPALGEQKCHGREDFACNPALLADTAEPCQSTADDCQAGELCIDGSCAIVLPGCMPSCRGDLDCANGWYCDQSFLSGVCVANKPVGKALGEPCTVPAANAPAEPDGCIGFCQADDDSGTQGHCAATCGLLNACGWNAQTQKYDGICLYGSVLTAESGYIGDFGFCTPTCNCSGECNDPALSCSLLPEGPLPPDYRGPALCFTPDPSTEEYDACSSGGGGSGEGGAPNSNVGGEGGAP